MRLQTVRNGDTVSKAKCLANVGDPDLSFPTNVSYPDYYKAEQSSRKYKTGENRLGRNQKNTETTKSYINMSKTALRVLARIRVIENMLHTTKFFGLQVCNQFWSREVFFALHR